jgi:hypothetical protein
MSDFNGTHTTHPIPGVAVCCMSTEARDLFDEIMEAWDEHKAKLPESLTCGDETWDPRESVYSFAYWLVRYSGLIQPASSPSAANSP